MKYSIRDFYLILKRRMTEQEIFKIAEARSDIFHGKMKLKNIEDDQMALSIYYKLFAVINNSELPLLNRLNGDTCHYFQAHTQR